MVVNASLNPLTLALTGRYLIEASAGTGKTWNLSAIYVRLILQYPTQSGLEYGLLPSEILVMTFTDAATAELKDRIRARLLAALNAFTVGHSEDTFLQGLLATFETTDYPRCVAQLQLALEWMDEAAIFTIHAWAKRMLQQHAFDSLSHFNPTLVEEKRALLYQVTKQYWRLFYYPLNQLQTQAITQWVSSPQQLLDRVTRYWQEIRTSLSSLNDTQLPAPVQMLSHWESWRERDRQLYAQLKLTWQQGGWSVIEQALQQGLLNRKKYTAKRIQEMRQWLEADGKCPNVEVCQLFTDQGLVYNEKALLVPLQHSFLTSLRVYLEHLVQEETVTNNYKQALLEHASAYIWQRYQQTKRQHNQFDFDDLLRNLHDALVKQPTLVQRIQQQFPVALVDEFQDTDGLQYACLSQIYTLPHQLLLMIGDPKQSIYRFRGADLATYLQAKQTVEQCYTLTHNFRSTPALVAVVNGLFLPAEQQLPQGAFRYRQSDVDSIAYTAVEAAKPPSRLIVSDEVQPALTLWQLASTSSINKEDYLTHSASLCAQYIATLLNASTSAHFLTSSGEITPCQAGDVAILVRTHDEAAVMQRALSDHGLPSVFLSDKSSVFMHEEAMALWYWLRAVHQPESLELVRAALASRVFAVSVHTLEALATDELVMDQWVSRFYAWRNIWQKQGIIAMLYQVMHQLGMVAFWRAQANGERVLTNVLHLGELLQQASLHCEGHRALIHWLEMQIHEANEGEDKAHLLRLESDVACIQIVTIHKSKGLEYPLVFVPFVMTLARDDDQQKKKGLSEEDKELSWQESIRLLYVAMTRASHALWLGVAQRNTDQWENSALGYLLGAHRLTANSSASWITDIQSWQQALAAEIRTQVIPMDEVMTQPIIRYQAPSASLERRSLQQALPRQWINWQITSYSHLTQTIHNRELSPAMESEIPLVADALIFAESDHSDISQYSMESAAVMVSAHALPIWQTLPAGAEMGSALHAALEWLAQQSDALKKDSQLLKIQLTAYWQYVVQARRLPEIFLADYVDWGWQLWHGPLSWYTASEQLESLILAQLARSSYWTEMPFYLPLTALNSHMLDARIQAICLPGISRASLSEHQLSGLLTGFVDMIFEYQGRYYVLDYKTNRLPDYQLKTCEQAIINHRYDVQACIYLVALHRLLQQRLPNYQYDQHMGGAIYWFVRGADTRNPQQGVWHYCPSLEDLTSLSACFLSDAS